MKCTSCGSENVVFMKSNGKWQCTDCGAAFNAAQSSSASLSLIHIWWIRYFRLRHSTLRWASWLTADFLHPPLLRKLSEPIQRTAPSAVPRSRNILVSEVFSYFPPESICSHEKRRINILNTSFEFLLFFCWRSCLFPLLPRFFGCWISAWICRCLQSF